MGTLHFLLNFAVNLKLFIKQKYHTIFSVFFPQLPQNFKLLRSIECLLFLVIFLPTKYIHRWRKLLKSFAFLKFELDFSLPFHHVF